MRLRRVWKGSVGTGLLLLGGCSSDFFPPINHNGGGGTTGAGDYLYVGNTSTGTIAEFALSSAGALSAVSGSPLKLGVAPSALAITPSNAYLYAGGGASGIYLLTINASNGALTVGNNGSALFADVLATSLQVESGGNYLLAGGLFNGASAIGTYKIGTGGVLTEPAPPVNVPNIQINGASDNLPGQIAIMPNDAYVYLTMGTSGVALFTFNTSGGLVATTTILKAGASGTVSNQDTSVAIDPSGRFLFVGETNAGLRVLSIGTGGSLSEIAGSPYTIGGQPRSIAFDSTGSYVYVLNAGTGTNSNSISAFSLSNGGVLSKINGQPFAAGSSPVSLTVDQSKKYVAVVNQNGNPDLQIYSFDATTIGKLNPGATAATDTDPAGAAVIVGTH